MAHGALCDLSLLILPPRLHLEYWALLTLPTLHYLYMLHFSTSRL